LPSLEVEHLFDFLQGQNWFLWLDWLRPVHVATRCNDLFRAAVDAVPGVRRIAVLADANISTPPRLRALEEAARARGIALSIHSVAIARKLGAPSTRRKQ